MSAGAKAMSTSRLGFTAGSPCAITIGMEILRPRPSRIMQRRIRRQRMVVTIILAILLATSYLAR